jgi:hypothetical protein
MRSGLERPRGFGLTSRGPAPLPHLAGQPAHEQGGSDDRSHPGYPLQDCFRNIVSDAPPLGDGLRDHVLQRAGQGHRHEHRQPGQQHFLRLVAHTSPSSRRYTSGRLYPYNGRTQNRGLRPGTTVWAVDSQGNHRGPAALARWSGHFGAPRQRGNILGCVDHLKLTESRRVGAMNARRES